MSIIVGVGHCGCSIAASFWDIAEKQRLAFLSRSHPLFIGERPRCILVDSEPRAIESARSTTNSPLSRLHDENLIVCHESTSGRGNNWAMGYFGETSKGQQSLLTRITEALRTEAESCDLFTNIVIIHSLSGGTGGGLGCRLIEEIRRMYPQICLFSVAIGCGSWGDTPLQHYNTMFSLGRLQESTDCVFYFSNKNLSKLFLANGIKLCFKKNEVRFDETLKSSRTYSIATLNSYIAQCLCGIFLPTCDPVHNECKLPIFLKPFDAPRFLSSTVPLNSTKFLEVRIASSDKDGSYFRDSSEWENMITSICKAFHYNECNQASMRSDTFKLNNNVIAVGTWIRGICVDKKRSLRRAKNKKNKTIYKQSTDAILAVKRILRKAIPVMPWQQPLEEIYENSTNFNDIRSNFDTSEPIFEDVDNFRYIHTSYSRQNISFLSKRSITVCINRSCTIKSFEKNISKASEMYDAGAYVHWYEKYGADRSFFNNAFHKAKSLVTSYKAVCGI